MLSAVSQNFNASNSFRILTVLVISHIFAEFDNRNLLWLDHLSNTGPGVSPTCSGKIW